MDWTKVDELKYVRLWLMGWTKVDGPKYVGLKLMGLNIS